MRTECPICHQALEVDPEWLGQRAQCPCCGEEFTVTREIRYSEPIQYYRTPIWRRVAAIVVILALAGGAYWAYSSCCAPAKKDAKELFKEGKRRYKNKDYADAAKLFRDAAEQGHVEAQFYFGECCFSGHGVPKDYAEAFKWYRKAAEQGHAEAQYALGGCYYLGKGVTKDHKQAVYWLRKSAAQGNADAQKLLTQISILERFSE